MKNSSQQQQLQQKTNQSSTQINNQRQKSLSPSKHSQKSNTQNPQSLTSKIFPLNKQVILSCRKLETGPLENYIHMATLIHKLNLLLLEYENIKQLRAILRIVYSKQLLNSIIDFSMNTDHFAQFGIRLLEILSLEYSYEIAKSDAIAVVFGLLRTNDYETVVQCLSFIKVLVSNCLVCEIDMKSNSLYDVKKEIKIGEILNKKLLVLVMRTVQKQPEIEYVACLLDIVNLVIKDKEMRDQILNTVLKEDEQTNTKIDYLKFLKTIDLQSDFRTIKELHKKISRQIKELEIWGGCQSIKQ